MTDDDNAAVAEAEAMLAELTAETRRLRENVHAAEVRRRRANRISLSLIGLVAVLVVVLLGVAWQSKRTNDTIVDCTAPTGRCYRDGQARTAGAVQSVLRISIYTNECARLRPDSAGLAYDQFLEQCVAAKLAAVTPRPTPTRR